MDRRTYIMCHSRAGFSLMEILIAIGIFAVGLVAVAAIFPTAITIQSETIRDLQGQQVAQQAKTQFMAIARSNDPDDYADVPNHIGNFRAITYRHDPLDPTSRSGTLKYFTFRSFDSPLDVDGRTGRPEGVQPMIDQPLPIPTPPTMLLPWSIKTPAVIATLNAPQSFHSIMPLEMRSFPKNIVDPRQRDYFWYPFIKTSDLMAETTTWKGYIVVMQRVGTSAVPEMRALEIDKTRSFQNNDYRTVYFYINNAKTDYWLDNDVNSNGLPDLIQPGDKVLDDEGTVHTVMIAEKDYFRVQDTFIKNDVQKYQYIYYGVSIEPGTVFPDPTIPKREMRSPIVDIQSFDVAIQDPTK